MAGLAAGQARPERLLSLDVFRGATIAAMILVNNPGSSKHTYAPLQHADWHGCTPTDLVFPFFVFIIGVAVVFALGKRRDAGLPAAALWPKIARRSATLFALGLGLAAWPLLDFAAGLGLHDNLRHIRIPGVLQRLALCYLGSAAVFLHLGPRRWPWLVASILVGYWLVMALVPVPGLGPPSLDGKDTHIAAWLDRTLMPGHLWSQSRTWDPEGLLSTLPALCTAVLGLQAGVVLRGEGTAHDKALRLFVRGALLVLAGQVWGVFFPINKPIWTSSYVLFTGGLATCALALCFWLFDVEQRPRLARPFVVYGVNAITAFVLSGLLARTLGLIRVESGGRMVSLRALWQQTFFAWEPLPLASLAHALVWVLGLWLVLLGMHRRGWVIKV